MTSRVAQPPSGAFAQRERRQRQAHDVPPDISVSAAPTTSANAAPQPAAIVLLNRPLSMEQSVPPDITVSAAPMANKPVEREPSRRALALRRQTPVRIANLGHSRPPLAPHQSAHARHARRIQIRRHRARPQLAALATRAQQAATGARAHCANLEGTNKAPAVRAASRAQAEKPRRLAPLHRANARCNAVLAHLAPMVARASCVPMESTRTNPGRRHAPTALQNPRQPPEVLLPPIANATKDTLAQMEPAALCVAGAPSRS